MSSAVADFTLPPYTSSAEATVLGVHPAEQHVGERAVHRLAHDDRQDQARRAVERPGDDQQVVVEHEAHHAGRQAGVGIEQRDDRRHVGPADRHHQAQAERQAEQDQQHEHDVVRRIEDQPHAAKQRRAEQREVDDVLLRQAFDRAGNQLLQLAERHEAAGERQAAEQHLERQDAHREAVDRAAVRLVVVGDADQRGGQRAERVRQRRPLRHGGHRHPDGHRRADQRADHDADRAPT